jgi:hypothetical protein
VISFRHRTWWRNFRDGGRVTLQLRGTTVPAFAQAITNEDVGLTSHLTALITKHPRYAKYLGITISADGAPASSAVAKAAETHVLVHLALGSVLNTVAEPHKEDTGYVHEHRA